MKALTIVAALGLLAGATAAQAATWGFSYQSGIGRFTGRLEGALQADGNTILVTAVPDFIRLDGAPLASYPFVTTGSTIYGTPRAASVTLDGAWLDFLACTDEFCSFDGFGFDPDTIEFTPTLITSIPADGFEFGYREPTDPAQWAISAVPEPAAWGLLVVGFGLVGGVARRRVTAVSA